MEHNIEDLSIRLLQKDDREKVYELFRNLGEEGSCFFNRNEGNEKRTYSYLDGNLPDHIFWASVADTDDGEEIAGIVFLWKKDTGVPWLGIGIAEKWKGRHLGRRLMDTAKKWAQEHGAGDIMLTTAQNNFRGQGLYSHMGYEKLGVHHDGEFLYLLTL